MIFISYRISDSLDLVGRLDESLTREFGAEHVFRDKSRLQGGHDWTEVLTQNAKSCKVMLVIIGATWQGAAFADGERKGFPRLSDPEDWVRREITLALDQGNIVVPIFLNDAILPEAGWLRNCGLERLHRQQGEPLRSEEYETDLVRLIGVVRSHCPELSERKTPIGTREPIRGLRPGNLTDLFRDRTDQLRELRSLLRDVNAVFVCIIGRGGIGKTALLSKLCAEVECGKLRLSETGTSLGVDGLVYWPCDERMLTLELLCHEFGMVLGQPHTGELLAYVNDASRSDVDKCKFLLSKFRHGRCLLILDNLEDVLDEDRQFADVSFREFLRVCMTTTHGLQVVGTSRVRVKLAGDVARAHRLVQLEAGLPDADAISFLRDLDPEGEFGLRGASDDALTVVARRCYGLPRALEKVRQIVEEETLETLLEKTELFTESVLENLIADHYRLMSDAHRRVLEALAIYGKPVPASAVQAILRSDHPDIDVRACLNRLARNSTVYVPAPGTFDLHPMDREYNYERIPDTGSGYSKAESHLRAAEFFRTQQQPWEHWRKLDDLADVLNEFDHLVRGAAFDRASDVLQSVDWEFLRSWGHFRLLIDLHERLNGKLTRADQEINHLNMLGVGYAKLGNILAAIDRQERALSIARGTAGTDDDAMLLNNLSMKYPQIGNTAKAMGCCLESLTLLTQHTLGEARIVIDGNSQSALRNLGDCMAALGEVGQAYELYRRSLSFAQSIVGNDGRRREAVCLERLGRLSLDQRHYDEAREYFEQAVAIADAIPFLEVQSWACCGIALGHLFAGDFHSAALSADAASKHDLPENSFIIGSIQGLLALLQGNKEFAGERFNDAIARADSILANCNRIHAALDMKGIALSGLALSRDEVQLGGAVEAFKQAREICRDMGVVKRVQRLFDELAALDPADRLKDVREAVFVSQLVSEIVLDSEEILKWARMPAVAGQRQGAELLYVQLEQLARDGLSHFNTGDNERARECFLNCADAARAVRDRRAEGNALGNLGCALGNLGRFEESIDSHEQALAIDRELGDLAGEAQGSWDLGETYEKMGQHARAAVLMQVKVDYLRQRSDPEAETLAERVATIRSMAD